MFWQPFGKWSFYCTWNPINRNSYSKVRIAPDSSIYRLLKDINIHRLLHSYMDANSMCKALFALIKSVGVNTVFHTFYPLLLLSYTSSTSFLHFPPSYKILSVNLAASYGRPQLITTTGVPSSCRKAMISSNTAEEKPSSVPGSRHALL